MYKLQPYSGRRSRHRCPACNSKELSFSLYVEENTGIPLAPNVGRCNRQKNCSYHYSPASYFKDHGAPVNHKAYTPSYKSNPAVKTNSSAISNIPSEMVLRCLSSKPENHFKTYLKSIFGIGLTESLVSKYLIGTSKHWRGATAFFQKDMNGTIRAGKIMLYDAHTGLRVKDPFNHITWVHTVLKIENCSLKQCLFGEHLLTSHPTKPTAIVESEKTAIICSVYFPQYVWLATGGMSNFSSELFKPLFGRSIFAFPDLGGYEKWKQKADLICQEIGLQITVSDFLERNASNVERRNGYDLADYLVKRDSKFGWALTVDGYPVFWDTNLPFLQSHV